MSIPRTEDFSVKFGKSPDMGLEGVKAFPFIYSLVNHNDDPWVPYKTDGNLELSNLSCLGPIIPASTTRTVNVVLDPDYNFKLLGIRYSAYKWIAAEAPNGVGHPAYLPWYVDNVSGMTDGINTDDNILGTPLIRYVRASVSFQGSGSVILYGGPNTNIVQSDYIVNGKTPLPMEAVQGYEYGHFRVSTPYLLPMQGTMVVEITNDFTQNIVVAAAIYGMKIRE